MDPRKQHYTEYIFGHSAQKFERLSVQVWLYEPYTQHLFHIDVDMNVLPNGGMVGDVDFASVSEVSGAITPVPGCVGPLTNVVPLKQCAQAEWQLAGEKHEVRIETQEYMVRS